MLFSLVWNFRVQSFGRNIEKLIIAEDAVFQCHDNFFTRHTRIDSYCFYSPVAQIAYLVFHQGNKRGDNQT